MSDELVGFFKGAVIKQKLDALPRGHLAFFMLPFAALGSASFFRKAIALLKFCELFIKIHGGLNYNGCDLEAQSEFRVAGEEFQRNPAFGPCTDVRCGTQASRLALRQNHP